MRLIEQGSELVDLVPQFAGSFLELVSFPLESVALSLEGVALLREIPNLLLEAITLLLVVFVACAPPSIKRSGSNLPPPARLPSIR